MNNKRCEVEGCLSVSTNDETIRFFHFPRNKERQNEWFLFCNKDPSASANENNVRRRKFICSLHFAQETFKTSECNSLLRNSKPTIRSRVEHLKKSCHEQQPCSDDDALSLYSLPSSSKDSGKISHLPSFTPSTSVNHHFAHHNENTIPPLEHFVASGEVSNFVGVEKVFQTSLDVGFTVPGLSNQGILSNTDTSNTFSTPKGRSLSLARIQMTRKSQLSTPRKRYLYAYAKRKERTLKNLKRKIASKEKHLMTELTNFESNNFVNKINLSNKISKASAVFLGSQLRCAKKKPKGRRWTLEEKVMALSIYKKSPKAYRFMRCMFALPCKQTLNCLLGGIPFGTGINEEIFNALASTINDLEDCDKTCVLQFDEMSIREHLSYNPSLDLIVGVEDYGNHGRTSRFANQVMVFMVSGLLKKWKQPVAYFFSSGGIPSDLLVDLIKAILLECKKVGLRVLATVCDMGANQRKAVRLLGSTKTNPQFQFEGQNIITIFDPCHLIKCIRNQLKLHDIIIPYHMAGETNEGKVSWKYCEETYQRDKLAEPFRWLWKLTDRHLNPTGRDKLRVKLAAQVLSHSVAASIYRDVANGLMTPDAISTGYFVEFVDQLFDSLNGTKGETSKQLRGVITSSSPHFQFWEDALVRIDGWKFLSNKQGKFQRPPSQDGLIMTLQGMKLLWTCISQEKRNNKKISYLVPRNVNQDPLENTFGAIRSNCGSNCKPNVAQFVGSFKSCIINGLAYQDVAKGSNCEVDSTNLLNNLHIFLNSKLLECTRTNVTNSNVDSDKETAEMSFLDAQQDSLPVGAPRSLSAVSYVSGYIAKRILVNSTCQFCRSSILDPNPRQSTDSGLLFKEYGDDLQRLTYPSEELVKAVDQCSILLEKKLEEMIHEDRIIEKLTNAMEQEVSFEWIQRSCAMHGLTVIKKIVKSVCLIGIPWWCKKQNRKNVELLKQKSALSKSKHLQQSK